MTAQMMKLARMTTLAAMLGLGACFGGQDSGPEDIYWDRDACELCIMLISDARFVAEVRGGEKKTLYKFDDIGCAINWLNDKEWSGAKETEIWVADFTSTRENLKWLKARDARYEKVEFSPMNYGFAAYPAPQGAGTPRGIDFVAMTNEILKGGPNHICGPHVGN